MLPYINSLQINKEEGRHAVGEINKIQLNHSDFGKLICNFLVT